MAIKASDVNVALEELLNRTAQLVPHVWERYGWQTVFMNCTAERLRLYKIDASYGFAEGDKIKIYQSGANFGVEATITAIEEEADHIAAILDVTLTEQSFGGTIERIIEDAEWTKPPNALFVEVTAIAHGGDGGGAGEDSGGEGGGAGSRGSVIIPAAWVPDTLTVSIGADGEPVVIDGINCYLPAGPTGESPGGNGGSAVASAAAGGSTFISRGGSGGATNVDAHGEAGEGGYGWGAGGGGNGQAYTGGSGVTRYGGGGGEGGIPGPPDLKAWAPKNVQTYATANAASGSRGAPGYVRIITWCGRDLRSS